MRLVGAKVERVEDRRILTGRGRYVDDVHLPRMLHAAFVRSPFAHARVTAIDVAEARSANGVAAVFTGAELAAVTRSLPAGVPVPGMGWPVFHALATDRVRFVGDPVALVVAESRYLAEDACELVDVEYDPLPTVADADAALDPSSVALFDDLDGNVLYRSGTTTYGDLDAAFAEADRVVRETFRQHRVGNVPMETRGAVADYDPGSGQLTYHAATQSPHGLRFLLSSLIDHPLERIRVLCGDIGGSFGLKGVHREDVALAAATKRLGRR